MKILVVGSGGREHVLCWKIAQSKLVDKIYCAPGNAGTAEIAENVNIKADHLQALLKFAKDKKIDLTCVGPEIPLVLGIVGLFEENGLKVFGPSRNAALLEGSKIYAKEIMVRCGIPTAEFKVFDDAETAKFYVHQKGVPLVIKADGLCAGKGVTVASTVKEAEEAIEDAFNRKIFGEAGERIVIEEALEGEEASILVMSDGKNKIALATSQDHKRVFDNDKGPNTGGMGAYSPAPIITKEIFDRISKEIIEPIINGMYEEGNVYKGILYAGVMLTKNGPKVLEFNVRFGDPETQAVLPRMQSDLVELMLASIDGTLKDKTIKWTTEACVSVVCASGGYPGDYKKGVVVNGLEYFKDKKDIFAFHAGTRLDNGNVVTTGGRVINVVGLGKTIKEAIDKTYEGVVKVSFQDMHYRKDIGGKTLKERT